jgi:hypothetical protein
MEGLSLATIATAVITATIGLMGGLLPWAVDNNILGYLRSSKLKLSGKWIGFSEFIPLGPISVQNSEHYFRLKAGIRQRGRRIKIKEEITGIFDKGGSPLDMRSSREFVGSGKIEDNNNILFDLQELTGLTIGSGYLVANTWGNQLDGYLIVRSENSTPVIVKLILVREGIQLPNLVTGMLEETAHPSKTLPQKLPIAIDD